MVRTSFFHSLGVGLYQYPGFDDNCPDGGLCVGVFFGLVVGKDIHSF